MQKSTTSFIKLLLCSGLFLRERVYFFFIIIIFFFFLLSKFSFKWGLVVDLLFQPCFPASDSSTTRCITALEDRMKELVSAQQHFFLFFFFFIIFFLDLVFPFEVLPDNLSAAKVGVEVECSNFFSRSLLLFLLF